MNQFLSFFAIILLALPLSARENRPLVVATASIFADMARNIAGDQLEIKSIVPIGGDPHIYEPTPRDAQLVADADLILKNGLTFEGWLIELIENSGTRAESILLTEGIEAIQSDVYKNSTDPHAWMNAINGVKYIENIKDAFIKLDPANREIYEFNYKVFKGQLEDLDRYIQEAIEMIPENRRILITSHDAFKYYGHKYGIQLEAILGTSTDAEAQTSDIMRLNRVIRESGVPALFIESTVNPKLLQQLASDNNIKIGGQLYADSIGDQDSPAPSYYDMLKYNTDTIVRALSQEKEDNPEMENAASPLARYVMIGLLAVLFIGGFLFVVRKMNV